MFQLASSFNTTVLENDVLRPSNDDESYEDNHKGDEDAFPQAVAVLTSPCDSGFDMTIRVSSDDDPACLQVLLGIACSPAVANHVFSLSRGFFALFDDQAHPKLIELTDWCLREASGKLGDELEQIASDVPVLSGTPGIHNHAFIRMIYRSTPEPVVSFAVGDQPPEHVRFTTAIGLGKYKPCVIICGYTGQKVQVVNIKPLGTKRCRAQRVEDDNFTKLWNQRRFSDAVVTCGGQSFPVHRAVLCAKSGVFTSLFEGAGTEGTTATVDLSGEDAAAVDALLEHIYTNELPESANAAVLLPLADRFEVFDCVDDCAEALEGLAMKRPSEALRVLRPYAEDRRLCKTWDRVCTIVLANRELALSVLRNP